MDFLTHPLIAADREILALETAADFRTLGPAHLLMTGGTGFFGSWFTVAFAAARSIGIPVKLSILTRSSASVLRKNPSLNDVSGLNWIDGDVRTFRFPQEFSHILHFATTSADRVQPELEKEMREVIVQGTRNIADQSGAAKLLLASSGAVYGAAASDRPQENDMCLDEPTTAYGEAKREAEAICLAKNGLCLRGFAFGGPMFPMEGPYALSNFVSQALTSSKIEIAGNPDTQRSYLDGRDLSRALVAFLARGKSGECYNLGSSESVTMQNLAQQIANIVESETGKPVPVSLGKNSISAKPNIYVPSTEKSESIFKHQISTQEMLSRTLTWMRRQKRT